MKFFWVFMFFCLFALHTGKKALAEKKQTDIAKTSSQKIKSAAPTNQKKPSPTSASSSKQPKTRWLDFKSAPAPWLKRYPMIQKEVEKIIQSKKKEIIKYAKEFHHPSRLPFELHIKEIKLFQPDNQDIVSLRLHISIYSGGFHGSEQYHSWNWSKKKQKFLSLDEWITPPQFSALVEQARQILDKQETSHLDDDDEGRWYKKMSKKKIREGTSKKEDFKIWNLHKKEIIIMFEEYQVAPYVAGNPQVSVSLDSLKQ